MKPKLDIDVRKTPGYEADKAKIALLGKKIEELRESKNKLEESLDSRISTYILAKAAKHYGYEKDKIYYAVPASNGKILKVLFKDYTIKWRTEVKFVVAIIKGNNISHMQELDHSLWSLEEDTKFDTKSNSK